MAGRGPAPKANRQRRNVPTHGDYTRLAPLTSPILPSLTDLLGSAPTDSGKWPRLTQLLWNAWREDPVTATWTATEVALAGDTICLHAQDPVGKASEIRIRIDTLALSPKGRRDARLLLPDEQPDEAAPPQPAAAQRELPEAV